MVAIQRYIVSVGSVYPNVQHASAPETSLPGAGHRRERDTLATRIGLGVVAITHPLAVLDHTIEILMRLLGRPCFRALSGADILVVLPSGNHRADCLVVLVRRKLAH